MFAVIVAVVVAVAVVFECGCFPSLLDRMSGCVCCCGALLRLRASVVAVSVVVLVAAAADVAVFTAVVNATGFPTSYSTDPRCCFRVRLPSLSFRCLLLSS